MSTRIAEEQEQARRIEAMMERDGLAFDGALDGAVCDHYADKAAAVNNDGIEQQLRVLINAGWSEADLLDAARAAREDSEELQRRDEKRGLFPDKEDVSN